MSNMVVRTNIFSLNAHRNMKNVGLQQKTASNRLSSGYRINSAADDAAGLAISENMRAQIRGLDQASRNAQDGQAMLLTTEGGLEEIGNMMQRVRELMVQAPNDTNTQGQRNLIAQELNQLGREVVSMQNRVEFNTNRVLAMGPVMKTSVIDATGRLAIDANNTRVMAATLNEMLNRTIAARDLVSEVNMGDTTSPDAVTQALSRANIAFGTVQNDFGTLIANGSTNVATTAPTIATAATWATNAATTLNNLNTRIANITTALANLNTTQGQNMRNTFNTEFSNARQFVNANSSGQNIAFYQVGANASQGISFDFETVSRAVSAAGYTMQMMGSAMEAPGAGSGIGNGTRISHYISYLDASINDISKVRANLGAVQNRMDFTMRSLDISSENLQDSESRVRNADVAREMMRFTMSNVLQQAAVSMLSQANQMPQNLLQLLR
ncbi:MAG: flagellin [Defluviitaleaceae bacterium]|nr:flagellin [Defluviitaleaceae bacterium]